MQECNLLENLERIEKLLTDSNLSQKELMTIEEAAAFLGFKKSYLYRLTSERKLPFYKPGHKVFFKKAELEAWVFSNREKPDSEIEQQALNFLVNR